MKCIVCNKKIRHGYMTDSCGSFECHEGKCFFKMVDNIYGKHCWMEIGNNKEDEYGGYYIVKNDVIGGYRGTRIFYTELEVSNE